MRKTTIVVVLVLAVLAMPVFAATYSNPIGFVKIDLGISDYTMVAIPLSLDDMRLNDSDDSVTCAGEALSENLNGTMSAGTADKLYFWNGAGFDIYYLFDGSGYPAYDGKWFDLGTGLPDVAVTLELFQGFYILRGSTGAATVQATVLGDVQTQATIDIVLDSGYTMITYPYPIDVDINGGEFANVADGAYGTMSAGTADKVYSWNGTGFDIYYLFDGSGYPTYDDKWFDLNTGLPAVGKVFTTFEAFYYRRAETQLQFTWSVELPYTLD